MTAMVQPALMSMWSKIVATLCLIVCVALPACSSTPAVQAGGAVTAVGSVSPPVVAPDYIIGAGDVLRVNVLGRPELSAEAPVRPDGKISLPLASEVDAVGKTPKQLAHDVEGKLELYVRSPSVSVVVQQARSSANQVTVIGQVGRPGSIAFRNGMTVLDAILESNGLTQFAAGNRAVIVRTVSGTRQRIKVRVANLLNDGDLTQNYQMQAGDVLVVPEAHF